MIEADADVERLVSPIWPITTVPGGWSIEYRGRDATIVAGEWPADRRITVTAGEPMPNTVKQAVMLMAGYWFDQRNTASADPVKEVPYGATALLALNRRVFA